MISRILLMAIMIFMLFPSVSGAKEGMCDSVKSQIKKAHMSGGKARATRKVKQMIAAYKYLSGNISTGDLLVCIMQTGIVDAATVKAEAKEAGISPAVINKAVASKSATSSFWEAASRVTPAVTQPVAEGNTVEVASNTVEVQSNVEETEDTYVPADTYVDTITVGISETQTDLGGGVPDEVRCQQISPWTWCAY